MKKQKKNLADPKKTGRGKLAWTYIDRVIYLDYVERIQQLVFAHKESARFFATTYQQFDDGKILHRDQRTIIVNAILKDPVFAKETGLTEENLNAVFSDDGGVDYMLENIADSINPARRITQCRPILDEDKANLIRLVASQLPPAGNAP